VATHKDLAAAFRRVNPATPFDVDRAYKWLQGRAQPREQQIYEDWSKVLGLDRPGQWIADCDAEAFLDEICVRHGRDREDLLHRLEEPASRRNRWDPSNWPARSSATHTPGRPIFTVGSSGAS